MPYLITVNIKHLMLTAGKGVTTERRTCNNKQVLKTLIPAVTTIIVTNGLYTGSPKSKKELDFCQVLQKYLVLDFHLPKYFMGGGDN